MAVATHLEKSGQIWRLLGAIGASGVAVGVYAIIQFYGLDPFGIHVAGEGVVSSIGNPIFTGALLLMTAPIILALALRCNGASESQFWSMWWVIPLTIPLLGMAFTLARGPWVGLAAGITTLLALLFMAVGWKNSFRALTISAGAIAVTWTIVMFIPNSAGGADLAPRALPAGSAVISSLSAENPDIQPQTISTNAPSQPASMETRVLLWKGAVGMALDRPWFRLEDPPVAISMHLFGYGPEFFNTFFH